MKASRGVRFEALSCAVLLSGVVAAGAWCGIAASACADEPQSAAPARQVMACYFHRTHRCPTCKKISALSEKAIRAGFAGELKRGEVAWTMIDYQDARNQKLTEGYKITRPTLVVIDVREGKVARWQALPKVWSLVFQPEEEFSKYVQDAVRGYLETD